MVNCTCSVQWVYYLTLKFGDYAGWFRLHMTVLVPRDIYLYADRCVMNAVTPVIITLLQQGSSTGGPGPLACGILRAIPP